MKSKIDDSLSGNHIFNIAATGHNKVTTRSTVTFALHFCFFQIVTSWDIPAVALPHYTGSIKSNISAAYLIQDSTASVLWLHLIINYAPIRTSDLIPIKYEQGNFSEINRGVVVLL